MILCIMLKNSFDTYCMRKSILCREGKLVCSLCIYLKLERVLRNKRVFYAESRRFALHKKYLLLFFSVFSVVNNRILVIILLHRNMLLRLQK